MKIGRRLMISYAVVLIFLAAVMIVAVNRLDGLTQTTREVVAGDAVRATLASEINLHAQSAAGRLLLLFILDDREQRVAIYQEIDQHNAMIDGAIGKLKPLLDGSGESAALARVIGLRKAYEEQFSATVEELEAGDGAVASKRMSGATRTTLNALLAARTAEATGQIDQVIATINAQTAVAARDIQAGRSGMDRGMDLIKDIVAPLGELRDGAQSSLDSLEKLTAVAEEQARESQAIAAHVSAIVAMAAANSQAAEAVAAITGELVEMANGLQQSAGAFRL